MNGLDIDFAWGVSVGSMNWSTYGLPLRSATPSVVKKRTPMHSAASVLLPRTLGEPYRLDHWSPPHPRGSGEAWPSEASVGRDIGSGRFPLAAAWSGRQENLTWNWRIDEHGHKLNSLDAIAVGISELTSMNAGEQSTSVVIPNDFRQQEQQRLLDACTAKGLDVALIWLPIAACLAWIREFHGSLPDPSGAEEPLVLPVIHADWGNVRCTIVELVAWKEDGEPRWLPARRRPSVSDTCVSGFGWQTQTRCDESNFNDVWRRLFTESLRGDSGEVQRESDGNGLLLEKVSSWDLQQSSPELAARSIAEALNATMPPPVGLVVAGDFAERLMDDESMSRFLSERLEWRSRSRVVIANGAEGEDYLASGAAMFTSDWLADRTSYLDTLPELELFIDRSGKYEWLGLLGEHDQFVRGGRQWELQSPITGLAIPRGSARVKLVVAHEEFRGVREISAHFESISEQRIPVSLRVSCTPAQGNAKLRLETVASSGTPSRVVLADWRRMVVIRDESGQPMDKSTYLETRPRAFPELRPRPADSTRWSTFEYRADRFLHAAPNANFVAANRRYLWKLLEASRIGSGKSAVSSAGRVPAGKDQVKLDRIASILFGFVRQSGQASQAKTDAIKTLAFICAACEGLDAWVHTQISQCTKLDETTCMIAGGCIRSPDTAALFIKTLLEGIPRSNLRRLLNYQMQALGRLFSTRGDILKNIPEESMYKVVRECLSVFSHEISTNNLAWLFEHSGLVVVYALRYRIYKSDFLEPDSELAIEAKSLFHEAIQKLEERSGSTSRGDWWSQLRPRAKRLANALQQLIDYIDRRGTGDILIAQEE